MLDEGALKKDPAEAKAPAADTVDSDAEAHTTSPDRLPNPQDALAANAAAVDTGADDAVSPTRRRWRLVPTLIPTQVCC